MSTCIRCGRNIPHFVKRNVCGLCDQTDYGAYTPTPEQIAAECEAILSKLNDRELRKRAGLADDVMTVVESQTDRRHNGSCFG